LLFCTFIEPQLIHTVRQTMKDAGDECVMMNPASQQVCWTHNDEVTKT